MKLVDHKVRANVFTRSDRAIELWSHDAWFLGKRRIADKMYERIWTVCFCVVIGKCREISENCVSTR